MPSQTTRSMVLEPRTREGSQRVRFGQIGQRIADAFRAIEAPGDPAAADTGVINELTAAAEEALPPRFPIARRGYHCASVDEYVTRLEEEVAGLDRELVQLRAQSESSDEVRSEIERIGEQTSAVLIAAYEQRDEIVRSARQEADRCLADARAEASKLTSESEARLRGLRAEGEALGLERDRLLEEARGVSVALAALVDGAKREGGEGAAAEPSGPDG